ncbi:MAG: serine hydrolase domain-containing protein [Gemmatimonadaceae bacterium]
MDTARNVTRENARWPLGNGLAVIMLSVVSVAAGAQAHRMDSIDTFVRAEMARQRVPGVAIGIVTKAGVLAAKGYGFANVELQVPVGSETIFQSGSVGKQFTSTAVMLLVEQGKIGLEDPITKFFPDAPASWRAITVRHLLTHTSGIPDYEGVTEGAASVDLRRDYTEDELVRLAFRLTLEFPPGSRWNYSNTGYLLLGVIIHKVSGQFYGDFLRDNVFAPLGMKTTRVISEEDIVPNRADGYRLDKGALKNQEWVSPTMNTTADGALYFSVRDVIAWDKGLRSGAILNPKSWAQMYDPVKLTSGARYPYGFGWSVDTLNGRLRLHHSGSWQGFKSYISRYMGEDLTIIVLANLAEADPGRFVDGIARILVPALVAPEMKPIPEREPEVRARLDSLLRQTTDGRLSPTDFAYLRSGFFPDVAEAYKKRMLKLGAVQQVSLLQRRTLGDDRIFTYELAYPTETLIVTLGLAPDGKLSLFTIRSKLPRL